MNAATWITVLAFDALTLAVGIWIGWMLNENERP